MTDELAKRHKQELKELNVRGADMAKGKKGAERKAVEDQVFVMKKDMALRHEMELRELNQRLLDEPAPAPSAVDDGDASNDVADAKKPSRAQVRFLAKQEKERQERERLANAQAAKPSARDLEANALADQMANLGMRIVDVAPDGDCLFGAVAHQRRFHDDDAMNIAELRDLAASTMQKYPAMFVPFLPEGDSLDAYCAKVRTPAEWGGQLELRALALGLRRPIYVYSARAPVLQMCRQDFPTATAYRRASLLLHMLRAHAYTHTHARVVTYHENLYALGEHYNSAVPDGDGDDDA